MIRSDCRIAVHTQSLYKYVGDTSVVQLVRPKRYSDH
jgi:hypothetical protein